jgi:hypothetical protein
VPGDLATAVGVDDRDVRRWPLVGLGAAAGGVDRRVFEEEQRVGPTVDPGIGESR